MNVLKAHVLNIWHHLLGDIKLSSTKDSEHGGKHILLIPRGRGNTQYSSYSGSSQNNGDKNSLQFSNFKINAIWIPVLSDRWILSKYGN